MYAYESFHPILAGIGLFLPVFVVLKLTALGGKHEIFAFNTVFAVSWFMAGLSAIYAEKIGTFTLSSLDETLFYSLSANWGMRSIPVFELVSVEGSLAIVIWRSVYWVAATFDLDAGKYVGIHMNMLAVSLSAVLGVKTCKRIFEGDSHRLVLLVCMYSSCGLIWLFSAIHLRDAYILLCISGLVYFWSRYLQDSTKSNLSLLALSSILMFFALRYLRTEFQFIPMGLVLVGALSLTLGNSEHRRMNPKHLVVIFAGLGATMLMFSYFADARELFERNLYGYRESSAQQTGHDSLGMSLVVDQPPLIRVFLGTIYLFLFPIPFWVGFQLDSVYYLFKSLNVVFFYFFVPILVLAVWVLISDRSSRRPPVLFCFFFSLVMVIGTALTSLETRHLGAILPALFVFAQTVSFSVSENRRNYSFLLLGYLLSVMGIHLFWLAYR